MKRSLLFLALLATTAHADVKLPAIFTDHLVLQRGKPVAIWGWAEAGEEVEVKFGDQTKKATASKDGNWKVSLDALEASAKPAKLKIKGKNEIVLNDILVGEVWLCSGQSNMGFTVEHAVNGAEEVAAANLPEVRLFSVPLTVADEPSKDVIVKDPAKNPVGWNVCTPQTVGNFTAVGFFFGRELHKKLNVPIGLINSSWGGTRAEAWTSKPALASEKDLTPIITSWEGHLKNYDLDAEKKKWEVSAQKHRELVAKLKIENATLPKEKQKAAPAFRAFEDSRNSQHRPAVLFNAMINPLVPFSMRGAIWYQGESNQGRAEQYLKLLPTMISDWRKQWADKFSFYIVQLASYTASSGWPELQWSELQTAIKPNFKSGLAVMNDIGEEKNIHPINKQEVGHRLALQALVKDYGVKDILSGGPIFGGGATSGNKYVISFSNSDGLKARDGGELKGFIIAGEDKVWKPAKAKIVGKQVQVWNEEIAKPAACRYAWQSWIPEANLVNKDGLPTSCFRTDKWDLVTKGQLDPFSKLKPVAKPSEEVRPAQIPVGKPKSDTESEPKKKAA